MSSILNENTVQSAAIMGVNFISRLFQRNRVEQTSVTARKTLQHLQRTHQYGAQGLDLSIKKSQNYLVI